MSSRRHLVQRSRNTQEVTDSPSRSLQRNSVGGGRQLNTELPPYEPLECALTPSAREQLERLQNSHDHSKYKKHIKSAILAVTEAATSSNDRLYERKFEAQKQAEKREKEGRENEEPTQDEKEEADYLKTLSRKVKTMTLETEKALRELIDYDDELAMFTSRLEGVIAQIGDAPAPRPARTRAQRVNPDGDVDSDDPDEEEPEEDVPAIAPSDLYKNTVQQYETQYRSKSMRARYDTNDYRNFKRVVHDAQHPEENAPPVPHANTWFPEDNPRSNGNHNAESSDDEIEIASATVNLKDLFTMQYFKEPWTSKTCGHTFEKSAFLDYLQSSGSDFQEAPPSRRRVRRVKCPQTGCDQMLVPEDFSIDKVIMRQVKRAQEIEARGDDPDEEEDEDPAPRGTQSRRPQELDSEDDDDEIEELTQTQKVKQERAKSRGLGGSRGRPANDSDTEMGD